MNMIMNDIHIKIETNCVKDDEDNILYMYIRMRKKTVSFIFNKIQTVLQTKKGSMERAPML
jgi:hypothetical protein